MKYKISPKFGEIFLWLIDHQKTIENLFLQ